MIDGEPFARVSDDVLPDVQDRAARGVDERAALGRELRHVGDGHAKRRQDHDVVWPERRRAFAGIRQEADPCRAQPIVDVRVVDDLAGQKDVAAGEAAPRLVGVVDGAIDAVAEAELAREVDGQPAGVVRKSLARTRSTIALS